LEFIAVDATAIGFCLVVLIVFIIVGSVLKRMQARPTYHATALLPKLMEAGTDLRYIQKLLDHANITTTRICAQVTNRDTKKVKSPLDSL